MLQIEITLTGLFPCFVNQTDSQLCPMGMRLPESASLNNNRAAWQAWKLILPASRMDRRPLHQESKAARGRDTAEAMLGGGAGSPGQEQGEVEERSTRQVWKQKYREP